jgi:hypothetical protein
VTDNMSGNLAAAEGVPEDRAIPCPPGVFQPASAVAAHLTGCIQVFDRCWSQPSRCQGFTRHLLRKGGENTQSLVGHTVSTLTRPLPASFSGPRSATLLSFRDPMAAFKEGGLQR